jgi:chromosome segregation ATPase
VRNKEHFTVSLFVMLLCLVSPSVSIAQTIVPPWVQLSPEEYQRMLNDAKAHAQNLEGFIVEMLSYKQDVDGQLGEQFSRLDHAQASANSLSALLATLRQDHTVAVAGLQQRDTQIDGKVSQLTSQVSTLDTFAKSVQSSVTALSTSTSNSLNALGTRVEAAESKNASQDATLKNLIDKLTDTITALKLLSDTVTSGNNALAQYMTTTAAKMKAIEDRLTAIETQAKPPLN